MKRFIYLSVLFAFLGVMSVVAKDLRTVTFKVEQMECSGCEKKVVNQVKFEKGLKRLDTDVKSRTVTITYDADKTSVEKLKASFAEINYEAKVISDVAGKGTEKK